MLPYRLIEPKNYNPAKRYPLVLFLHGAQDGTVPPGGSRDMIETMRALGGEPRYTEYPQGGHVIWDTAYATPDLIPWTFEQQRHLVTITVLPEPGPAAWVLALCAVGAGVAGRHRVRRAKKKELPSCGTR